MDRWPKKAKLAAFGALCAALAAGGAAAIWERSAGLWQGSAKASEAQGARHAKRGPAHGGERMSGSAGMPGMGDGSDCSGQYFGGARPKIEREDLAQGARELCFKGFAILHSQGAFTAVYVSEHLTRERVEAAEAIGRKSSFHEEQRLPPQARASKADYAKTGEDKGHFAPSEDMPDADSQWESFTMANMFMEDPRNNRVAHAAVERAVRRLAKEESEAYALTGISFKGRVGEARRAGRVPVPDYVWKAVYLPGIRQAGAYWERNAPDSVPEIISLEELRRRSGVDAFPAAPPEAKRSAGALPVPKFKGMA